MLNHPGDLLVLQTDFLYVVERVAVCIDFLKAHVRCLLFVCPFISSRIVPSFRSYLWILWSIACVAPLPRSRALPAPIPAMQDPCLDAHQDVFRGIVACTDAG